MSELPANGFCDWSDEEAIRDIEHIGEVTARTEAPIDANSDAIEPEDEGVVARVLQKIIEKRAEEADA